MVKLLRVRRLFSSVYSRVGKRFILPTILIKNAKKFKSTGIFLSVLK